MKTKLFHPFKYIAGTQALLIGLAAMIVTGVVAYFANFHLDGVIDTHINGHITVYQILFESLIDWLSMALILYLLGKYFSTSSIRFVDFAGTQAMARYPMLFVLIVTLLIMPPINFSGEIAIGAKYGTIDKSLEFLHSLLSNPLTLIRLVIAGLFALAFIAWMVALMYNAYAISSNLKGTKATWSFVGGLIAAEIVSKIVFWLTLK